MRNFSPVTVASVVDEEYAGLRQLFNQQQEIVRNSSPILYTGRAGIEMIDRILSESVNAFGLTEARGNTEVDSERYEWILASPDECFPRDENIPCWNGKVLEKVEVFQ